MTEQEETHFRSLLSKMSLWFSLEKSRENSSVIPRGSKPITTGVIVVEGVRVTITCITHVMHTYLASRQLNMYLRDS